MTMGSQLEASLQHDMDLIRAAVTEMAGQCERALRGTLDAIIHGDQHAAYLVILRDGRIDDLEQQLDRLALEFLVRQQPAGSHLRFAFAALKISTELERIGDHAEGVARRALKLHEIHPHLHAEPFAEMGEAAIAMLQSGVRAFLDADAELARTTMAAERTIDKMRQRIDKTLMMRQAAGELGLEAYALLSTMSRRLERVADEVRNMCAETLYMCTGDFAKHNAPEAFRILFVDQHNHCRSQMAEAVATTFAHPRLLFSSAGLDPRPIDPRLAEFLSEKGLDITGHQRPKSLDQIPNLEVYHAVVAFDTDVYSSLRFRRTPTVVFDWHVEDPSVVPGTLADARPAYEQALAAIRSHLQVLVEAIVRQD
ncbi:phosphate signaling complex protein PhoU [Luteitalea sp.]|uniref:phosphate signaling complex protein PhoU n=1 Tax=Luteitalea sp. TaxID=2004800 RepID=UPI0025C42F71|nr:phosphate signaling complex protein PhoU [Luteitalea sp.]